MPMSSSLFVKIKRRTKRERERERKREREKLGRRPLVMKASFE
jgi:hypothetical protein